MKTISNEEIKHVAKLAALDLNEDEAEKLTSQNDRILGHVTNISRVETSKAAPTSHTMQIKNVFRQDKVKDSLMKEEALLNAPDEMDGGFKVPKID